MKHLNQTHEVIINTSFLPINTDGVKDGDLIPYQPICSTLTYYQYNGDGSYIKREIPRNFILDLADQIRDIESKNVDMEYNDIIF